VIYHFQNHTIMKSLNDQVVVITGGSGGIGAEAARLCLEGGAQVLLVDLNEDALQETANHLNSDRVSYCVADVSQEEAVKKYVDTAVERYGRIDSFFNNAGIEGIVSPLTDYSESDFMKVIDVNLKGAWLGIKHVFPVMQQNGGGSIVITSSVAGLQGTANMIAYTASKHGVIGVMKVAALEGAPHNIRVNSIHPGPIDNRMMRSLEDGFAPGAGDEVKKGFEQMIPLGRYGTSEEVAQLAIFLFSPEGKYLTGAQYRVDGGMGA
jgi:NAD(P)-dependent dehydrogenase (short-subunit alcohol dehydrogenase family)